MCDAAALRLQDKTAKLWFCQTGHCTITCVGAPTAYEPRRSLGFGKRRFSVDMSSWGHDMTVDVVVANDVRHGSMGVFKYRDCS